MADLRTGVYEHFKGHKCLVLGVGRHSETEEELVVYIHPDAEGAPQIWIRPKVMFLENVDTADGKRPRFKYLS